MLRTKAKKGQGTPPKAADRKAPPKPTKSPSGELKSTTLTYGAKRRAPLAEAEAFAKGLREHLVFDIGGCIVRLPIVIVGSVRRRSATVKDLDLLVILSHAAAKKVLAHVMQDQILPSMALTASRFSIDKVISGGGRKYSLIVRRKTTTGCTRMHVDIFLATADEKPYALFHYTGDATYNLRTRAHAKQKGMLLNQYGVFDRKTRKRVSGSTKIKTEKDLAQFLGVSYHAPSKRTS